MGENQEAGLFFSIDDSAAGKVVGGEPHANLVAGNDADIVFPHFAREMGENDVAVLQFDPEHRVGEGFADDPLHLNGFFFRHVNSLNYWAFEFKDWYLRPGNI